MLSLLVIASSCIRPEITDFTVELWERVIERRNPDSVFLIMFYGDNCPACKIARPVFEEAAIKADGMVNFGTVNNDRQNPIAMRFGVKYLPTFIIISRNGTEEYTGKRTERALINAAARFIPDKTVKAQMSWKDDGIESAILFTDKPATPPMWASISCAFSEKLRIGISNDKELRDYFGVESSPSILFINSTGKIAYGGKFSFLSLREAISDFMAGRYDAPLQFHADYFLPEEYAAEAENFNGFCIIHCVQDLNDKFKDAKQKFNGSRMKFFYGNEDFPFKFMKEGDIWIISPKRRAAIKVDSIENLAIEISSLVDGTAKMMPIEQFEK